ncbi:arsenate reductase/protein-tyrosine-phosphatase family protein [Limobrevibacterium gyesilva]|uniref:Arsenate reductase ArsC n=1 Tax=Limobrevibacterium gyesilva TaxID=2991712 RepID=A0AA41YQL4_9PROT|nr:arsenate reductase ArsC [Limobrevibacterium gyesilva]MCW3477879.1 arsenate reductase ArsC [Limobrevibacterium gyesilva]
MIHGRLSYTAISTTLTDTTNSARSSMAEAILNRIGDRGFRAFSAGSDPAPEPMPEVIERLAVLGHDVGGLRSKSWEAFTHDGAPPMDFVIALCDGFEGRACPDFGGVAVTAEWPLPDPARFEAGAQRLLLINELYASLRRRLEAFANLPFASLDRQAVKVWLDELADVVRA